MKSYENLRACFNSLVALEALRGRVDPASGIRISVTRGDEPEIEFSTCEKMHTILDAMIEAQKENVRTWARFVRRDVSEANKTLSEIKADL